MMEELGMPSKSVAIDKKDIQILHEGIKKTLLHNYSRVEEEYLTDRSIFVAYDRRDEIALSLLLKIHRSDIHLSDIWYAIGQTLFYSSFLKNLHLGLLDETWKIIPDSLKQFLNNHVSLAIYNPSTRKLVVLRKRRTPKDLDKGLLEKIK